MSARLSGVRTFIIVLAALALFSGTAITARAATVSDLQKQIADLMKMLETLKTQVDGLSGSSSDTERKTNSGNACPNITRSLYIGMRDADTNGEVSALQRFLGVEETGYFGPTTEGKVREWQAKKGIVSSGNADTTGYGLVGQKTRALMRAGCADDSVTTRPKKESIERTKEPSCTISASNETPEVGESFRIKWSTKNVSVPVFVEDRKAGGEYKVAKKGSLSFSESSAYEMEFAIRDGYGGDVLCSVEVTTIEDEYEEITGSFTNSSLVSHIENPTIKGAASGVSHVGFSIGSIASGDKVYGSGFFSVTGGRWSHKVSTDLEAGEYTIELYDEDRDLLDTGILTIIEDEEDTPGVPYMPPRINSFNLEYDSISGHAGTFSWVSSDAQTCQLTRSTMIEDWVTVASNLDSYGSARIIIDDNGTNPAYFRLTCFSGTSWSGLGERDTETIPVYFKG
jgi:peptidoglycan hydrolase-like protein with peptidoglycan-binding domain